MSTDYFDIFNEYSMGGTEIKFSKKKMDHENYINMQFTISETSIVTNLTVGSS